MALAANSRGAAGLDSLRRAVAPALLAAGAVFAASYVLGQANAAFFQPTHEVRATIFAMFFCGFIVTALTGGPSGFASRVASAPFLRFLGKYSYGMYVLHHFFSY